MIYTVRQTNQKKKINGFKDNTCKNDYRKRAADLSLSLNIHRKVLPSTRIRFLKKSPPTECIMYILDPNFPELQAILISQTC